MTANWIVVASEHSERGDLRQSSSGCALGWSHFGPVQMASTSTRSRNDSKLDCRRQQASDTQHATCEIPLRTYSSLEDFLTNRPNGAQLIGVEMGGQPLAGFEHPERAVYLLGSEAMGLPGHILQQCQAVIGLESSRYPSYNLAVAGSNVLYHRMFIARKP
ncbi:MAG: TrmH family RNA methyltransferase [Bellilinea sp.]